jgi:DNA primase
VGPRATAAPRERTAGCAALEWLLGYAPPGWTRLVDRLGRSFSDETLLDAGVARRSSRGTLIDTFRDRVIFGIRATDGTIAGFIGRDLSCDPGAPKYLNTHQHPLFDKSSLLFGLHEGTDHTRAQQPVIVEGPLDALAIAARQQSNSDTVLLPVAPCGTAFTITHARQVAEVAFRHQSPVVVAMDGDSAGRTAALDAGERLRTVGVDVRVATLPNGTDPAEHLARPENTLDTFRAHNGLPLINLHVEHAIARQGDRMQWVEGRLAALRSLTNYLATYPPHHTARQIGWIAETVGLDSSTVTLEVADSYRRADDRHIAVQSQPASPSVTTGRSRSIGGIS